MKFSAADWAFYRRAAEPERYYARLRALGYEGVEMVAPERWEQARAAGLEIVNLSGPGMEKGLNRREHHAELLPKLREAIETAAAARIPYVIVFSGNRAGQPDAEGLANVRHGLEDVLPLAAKQRVTLLFEMLNSFEHKDYQADHGAYGFTLAKAVNSPWLKLVYDIYHMERMGDASIVDVPANLAHIAHLHLAESPKRDAPQAAGTILYNRIVPAIVKAGYRGYWGMEFRPQQDSLVELGSAREMILKAANS